MKIGKWGSVIKFQTSDKRILTFQGMQRNFSARTSHHNVIGKKPRLEFMGGDLETVTFTIELNALLCKKPRKVEDKLFNKARKGYYAPLVVGKRRILKKAMITSVSSEYDVVMQKGRLYSLKIDVTMTEYR